jgi:hypothetical protein
MALKDLIATDKDRLAGKDYTIDHLRNLLRDVYDVLASGTPVSEGLLSRIRHQMARGR